MKGRSILIIDDEVDICFLLSGILKKRSFDVSFANSLEEGLSKLALVKPSLLFLDINLPDGSGLETIEKVKKDRPDVKIIMISAFDSLKERLVANEKGADLFIGKPFNKDTVLAAVDHLLGHNPIVQTTFTSKA